MAGSALGCRNASMLLRHRLSPEIPRSARDRSRSATGRWRDRCNGLRRRRRWNRSHGALCPAMTREVSRRTAPPQAPGSVPQGNLPEMTREMSRRAARHAVAERRKPLQTGDTMDDPQDDQAAGVPAAASQASAFPTRALCSAMTREASRQAAAAPLRSRKPSRRVAPWMTRNIGGWWKVPAAPPLSGRVEQAQALPVARRDAVRGLRARWRRTPWARAALLSPAGMITGRPAHRSSGRLRARWRA